MKRKHIFFAFLVQLLVRYNTRSKPQPRSPIIDIVHLRKTQLEDKFESMKPTDQKDTHYRFKDQTSSKIPYDNIDESKGPS